MAAKGMKERRQHRVPLSDAALVVLKKAEQRRVNELVFPGRAQLPINNDSVWRLLQQMAWVDDQGRMVSLHGFRSTFTEWANTQTKHDWQLIELAMSHQIGTQVRRSYLRGDMLEERRLLMADWAQFCDVPLQPAKVITLTKQVDLTRKVR